MKQPLLANLLLLIAVILLGLIVWLEPFSPSPTAIQLTGKDPGTVTAIRLTRGDHLQWALQRGRHPGTGEMIWYLQHPVAMPADSEKVSALLGLLNTNSFRQYQIKSENLAKLGLQPPGWEIHLDDTVINFGKTEPIDQKRFVLVNDTVHLINDQYSQYRFGSPLMLANLDILPVDKSVKELHLPDKVIKKVDGQWQSTPTMDAMTQTRYKELIDQWRYAQALRVAMADETNKHRFSSDKKSVTVYLEHADQPVHFTIERNENDFIVTNEDWGVRYYLSPTAGEKLLHVKSSTRQ